MSVRNRKSQATFGTAVTVIKADGTREVQQAMTRKDADKFVKAQRKATAKKQQATADRMWGSASGR